MSNKNRPMKNKQRTSSAKAHSPLPTSGGGALKALAFLLVVASLLFQTHLGAQPASSGKGTPPTPADGSFDYFAAVIQKPIQDVEKDWLQFAAEETLIAKIQEASGKEVWTWVPAAATSQADILKEIRDDIGGHWCLFPEAINSADENKISVHIFELTASSKSKSVEASARPGWLPLLLLKTVRLTLEAMGVDKEKVETVENTGLGTKSSLALERYYRASAAWIQGKREKAVEDYESSLKADANFEPAHLALANGHYDLAQEAYVQGKWGDAGAFFQKSGEGYQYLETKAADRLAAASTEAEKKRLQADIESDKTSRKICLAWSGLCQGLIRRDAGDFQGAKEQFEAVLSENSDFAPARSELANLQLQQAQQEEKAGNLSSALESYLSAAEAYSNLGKSSSEGSALAGASHCAEKEGSPQEAIRLLIEAAKAYTTASDYRSARDLLLGPSFGLASTFGLLLEDNSSRSKAHFLLAVGFMRSSDRSLKEQCESPPDGTLRFTPTGDVITDADLSHWKNEKALDEARKAANLDPTDAAAFLLLGRTYLLAEHPDSIAQAIEAFTTAKKLQPDAIEPKIMLGETLYRANQFNEAEAELTAACETTIKPGQEDWANRGWGRLGDVRNKIGKYSEAAKAFEKAVSFSPSDAVSYLGWSTALFHLDRFSEAKEKLQEAKRLAPGLPGIDELGASIEKAIAASKATQPSPS